MVATSTASTSPPEQPQQVGSGAASAHNLPTEHHADSTQQAPQEPPISGNPRRNFRVNLETVAKVFSFYGELDLSKTTELPSYDDHNYRVFLKKSSLHEDKSYVVKAQNI